MEILLGVALVISIAGFLVLLDRKDERAKNERRELLNRIAEPEIVIPPEEVVEANIKAATEAQDQDFNIPEMYEHAAVGNVDPVLQRKES